MIELPTVLVAGAFAAALLVGLDRSIWRWIRLGLSVDYEIAETLSIPRTFPQSRVFRIAKLLIALAFGTLLVVTAEIGAEQHLELALLTLSLLVVFGITSFWEGVRAFRYHAPRHLPPADGDGPIQR